jgi:hypothetical protein
VTAGEEVRDDAAGSGSKAFIIAAWLETPCHTKR